MPRPTWARWITRASLVLGAAALAWTLHDVGLRTFAHFFELIGVFWIAVLAFETAITTLDAVAIKAFAAPDDVSLRAALLAQLAGRSVNAVTPGGNLGEPVKISILGEHVSGSRAVSTILLYNIVGFCVELWQVALAAPLLAWLLPMSPALRWLFLGTGAISLVGALGSYLLVRRGMLGSIAKIGVKLRLLSAARFARWSSKLQGIDDKMRPVAGASRRSRIIGTAAIVASRALSLCESLVLLHAMGMPITIAFVAAYTVGGLPIYFLSTLVPMGLGIAETGYYGLFAELGYNPVLGFMLVVARRCVLIAYATIGLILLAMNESVRSSVTKAAVVGAAVVLLVGCHHPAAAPRALAPHMKWGLVMHAGAGAIPRDKLTPEREAAIRADLERALRAAHAVLAHGGSSVDAVTSGITILEDSPYFNAGKGAVFTHDGVNELDAAIMSGPTHAAGAIAGVRTIKNPILLARAVMEKSRHVMMVGSGAEEFAATVGIERVDPSYFRTEERWQELQNKLEDDKFGTVGIVALDQHGALAAGTSTGGLTNKRYGRVGDSPIIGAGTYADEHCGVSATGHGEVFIRYTVAREICARVQYAGASIADAAERMIDDLAHVDGDGGVIALDREGHFALSFNTPGMYRGYIGDDGVPHIAIYK